MSRIHEKLGLKPQTTVRAATHGRTIVHGGRCPSCGSSYVIENPIHGIVTRRCAYCGTSWQPTVDQAAST